MILIDSEKISMSSSLTDLLTYLNELLQAHKKVQIDLVGTDMIFVRSVGCMHCGRAIPVFLPLARYKPALMPCSRCEYTCAHATDADVPIIKTVTQYSLRSSPQLLCMTLEELGFLPNTEFGVIDREGTKYRAMLTCSKK